METLKLQLGLNQEYKLDVTGKLNGLLADFQIYYMNLRGLHWNIKGRKFFMLHEKFEELYTETNEVVDEIAERILSLGLNPLHTFEDYLENKTIRVTKNVADGDGAISSILDNLKELLIQERDILEVASDANDEGTASLMSDLISSQEKLVWMLNSYLS
ncbi:DNA starvation/stationary phase protection protein [Cellulophaga sp. HaHa_2_95]|uniref:Dps family protein n=1 Tax=Cellulophaga TaxID=104264 RepID=UPI00131B9D9B|nr:MULTISPECIES: DNA starvation/stationary phase protection protein [unclassified Cellulophaga]QXP57282.1 DNA starvation/stationary phase protection protein [Cellulophaga sp. HaHa_2_95]